jgi:RNA exonuclease 4
MHALWPPIVIFAVLVVVVVGVKYSVEESEPITRTKVKTVKKRNGKKKKKIIVEEASSADKGIMSGLSSNWKALKQRLGNEPSTTSASTQSAKVTKTRHKSKTVVRATSAITTSSVPKFDPHAVNKLQKSATTLTASKLLLLEDFDLNKLPHDLDNLTSKSAEKKSDIGNYLSLDCEFVGVGPDGCNSALARVSIVNYYGNVVLDKFVKPKERVTDWRTWVSGVTPKHLKNAISFEEVQKEVASLLENRILVGHAVNNDLKVLMVSHPKVSIRDTSAHRPFRKLVKGTPSLKRLAQEVLNLDIQSGEHSSIEDAQATMLLFRLNKKQFDANLPRYRKRKA